MEHPTLQPSEISEHHIDIQKILATKNVKLPKFAVRLVNRILHVDDLNRGIYCNRDKFGLDFVHAFLEGPEPWNLNIKVDVVNADNIPSGGNPIIAGNHPLGGPDGLALMGAVGHYRSDIKFPVNDFLLYLPGPAPLFIPIDKVRRNTANVDALEQAFADNNSLLYFPAGLCSRKQNGAIKDLDWKPTFVKKSIRYQRDIVPFYFNAQNRKRFYFLANLRKRLGIKFNFEMALLPGEMFAQRGKTMQLIIGRPIPYSTFDKSRSPKEWAALVREYIYLLKDNPSLSFSDYLSR